MSADSKPHNRLAGDLLVSLTTFVIFIIGWGAGVRVLNISRLVLPPPSAVPIALGGRRGGGDLHGLVGVTLYDFLAGFWVGPRGGRARGFVFALSPPMERIFYP